MRRRGGGFTLIEVLIVMVIVGILAAIAIPSYTQYVVRSNRAEARAQLLEAAALLQRVFTQNNAYPDDAWFQANAATLRQSPPTGAPKYTITVANPGGNATFTLTAAPTGTMAGDPCGDLTLTHTGARGRSGSEPLGNCWDK